MRKEVQLGSGPFNSSSPSTGALVTCCLGPHPRHPVGRLRLLIKDDTGSAC